MSEDEVLDPTLVDVLLRARIPCYNLSEEKRRPWHSHVLKNPNFTLSSTPSDLRLKGLDGETPLLRIYDSKTGSNPDKDFRMSARAPRQRLATRERRKDTLQIHAYYRKRTPTPYISFTSSKKQLEKLVQLRLRTGYRWDQTLIAIDPLYRLKRGFPILNFRAEMDFYGIDDPYHKNFLYYSAEYLCLWEVSPEEVIGIWKWESIRHSPQWYEDEVLPALRWRRYQYERSSSPTETLDSEYPDAGSLKSTGDEDLEHEGSRQEERGDDSSVRNSLDSKNTHDTVLEDDAIDDISKPMDGLLL